MRVPKSRNPYDVKTRQVWERKRGEDTVQFWVRSFQNFDGNYYADTSYVGSKSHRSFIRLDCFSKRNRYRKVSDGR